ncbi:MAG: hypothetical protein IPN25_17040, partial [Sphingobacteriales bacterium]|nr:hypothetical protein [Sphingobacteriales bacterium]
ERRVLNTEIVMLHFNVGFSHTQANYNSLGYRGFGFPVGLTSVFGKKTSHFETGIGFWGQKSYNHKQKSSNNSEYRLQFKIGYRFQKLHRNRINFRIGYAPAYMFEWDDDYLSTDTGGTLYINLGYSFK